MFIWVWFGRSVFLNPAGYIGHENSVVHWNVVFLIDSFELYTCFVVLLREQHPPERLLLLLREFSSLSLSLSLSLIRAM